MHGTISLAISLEMIPSKLNLFIKNLQIIAEGIKRVKRSKENSYVGPEEQNAQNAACEASGIHTTCQALPNTVQGYGKLIHMVSKVTVRQVSVSEGSFTFGSVGIALYCHTTVICLPKIFYKCPYCTK